MKLPELQIDLKQLLFIALITQTALGVMFLILGSAYTKIDTDAADEMLSFIESTNHEYYQQIVSSTDHSYKRNFYSHYKEKGHRGLLVTGMFFLFLSGNIALPVAYMSVKGVKEEKSSLTDEEDETAEGEEGLEGDGLDDGESF